MAVRFLLDEHLRGQHWRAIGHHNWSSPALTVDAVRVGDPPDLPLGSEDPQILLWCEREDRILVSADASTMPAHLQAHLAAGRHCPGVFMLLPHATLTSMVSFLWLAAHASEPEEWRDRIEYIR